MKSKCILLLIFFLTGVLFAQNNEQKEIAVTVYNSDLGVIKDLRSMNINSGTSQIKLTDVAKLIDPTSVHIELDGEVIEQNYQYDLVSMDKILQKYIDKNINMYNESGELVSGTLLSVLGGQIVLEKNDGGLLMLPNTSKYRISVDALPEGLITKPTLVWMVNSNSSGKQDVEITYQTRGMNWHAEYVAVLNENDTKTDLNTPYAVDAMRKEGIAEQSQFGEKEFFEYHIYNLERPTTLSQNETKQISLFESSGVNVKKKFLYRSGSYYYGNKGKVAVIVEFANEEKNNLGVPMPKGKVRVYKSDGESVEFIGEDMIDHTPRNEKIKLKIGDAFDLVAEEVQTENKRISNKVSEQAFEITLKNRKKEDVVIEVERYLGLNWTILNSSINYEKKDAQNVIFKVPVKKDDTTVLKFKVRYSY